MPRRRCPRIRCATTVSAPASGSRMWSRASGPRVEQARRSTCSTASGLTFGGRTAEYARRHRLGRHGTTPETLVRAARVGPGRSDVHQPANNACASHVGFRVSATHLRPRAAGVVATAADRAAQCAAPQARRGRELRRDRRATNIPRGGDDRHGEASDTFPRLLLHHASVRGARPAIREKDLGIWQTWTWAQVADEVARAGRRARRARASRAAMHARHHRREPAAPLLVDGRRAGAAAASRCRSTRTRSRRRWSTSSRTPRSRSRSSRTRSRSTSCSRSAAVPGARAHRLRRSARAAQLRRSRGCMTFERLQALGREFDADASRLLSTARSAQGARTTPRRCSTPPAPPAARRAWCHTHRNADHRGPRRRRDGGLDADGRGARLPADGLGRGEHLLVRAVATWPASASTAPSRPTTVPPTCARSGRPTTSRRRACSRACSPR